VVWMVTPKLTGLTQSAAYTASITQGPASATGSSNNNLACVKQFVWVDGSTTKTNATSTTVTNDNHMSITINQNSLTGNNTVQGAVQTATTYDCGANGSQLQQDEQLTSTVTSKGSITQKQNTATTGSANVVLDIGQNQGSGFKGFASGLNNAVFEQSTNQVAIANTPNGTVTQTQGANVPDPPFSGLVGTINQDSSAKSTADVTQNETQCQDAVSMTLPAPSPNTPPTCPVAGDAGVPAGVTLTQTQWGPVGLVGPQAKQSAGRVPYYHKGYGKSEQTGALAPAVDSFILTQTSTQHQDVADPPHVTTLQANTMQGDCASSGNGSASGGSCAASQQATLNGETSGTTTDGYTAGTIDKLVIKCTNGHETCIGTPPPVPVLTVTPDDPSEDTNPTFEWTEGGSGATVGISFECTIDSGDPVSCDSGDAFPVGLGDHTFEVTASDNFGHTSDAASFSWTVVPYLTFEATDDGATAGWTGGVPGSSITLVVGPDSPNTFAQFSLHNFEGIAVSGLAEPTFTTDAYSGGNPRYEVDFSDGNYAFGYPSQAGFGTASWELVDCSSGCVSQGLMTWPNVQTAESTATVAAALIEVDGGVPDGTTFVISAFTFDGYSLSDFTDHWY
jgi:hypothetical protein